MPSTTPKREFSFAMVNRAPLPPGVWYLASEHGEPISKLPGKVYVRISTTTNGRFICTGLAIDDEDDAITTERLRNIPITELLKSLAIQAGVKADPAFALSDSLPLPAFDPATGFGALVTWNPTEVAKPQPVRRGGPPPTDERLQEFASIYRYHLNANPRSPVTSTAADPRIGVSNETVHNWLLKCFAKGYLEPTERAKRGRAKS